MVKIIAYIETVIKWALIGLAGSMLVWVFLMVVTRYIFSYTPSYGEELPRFLFVWIVFLGLPIVGKTVGHMSVEFVTTRCKGLALRLLLILSDLCASAFLLIMLVGGLEMVSRMAFQYSAGLRISMSYVYSVIPFGCLIMLLNVLSHLVKVIRSPAAELK